MISYAGIDLLFSTERVREWVRTNIDPAELLQFGVRHWPGRNLTHIPFKPPDLPKKIELDVLHWPTSASRFAVGWYVVDQGTLDLIRTEVYGANGLGYAAKNLIIDDGYDDLTASLWMLPATPLQAIGEDGLYLLTLVDERYFWWNQAAAITVTENTTTWTQLYAAIAAALGVSITVDAIDADYLKPPASAGTKYEALPLLLDAVAYATGRRIVRQFDGTIRAWSPTNALAQEITSLAAVEDKLAGGELSLSTSGDDNTALVPRSVTVTFPRLDSGVPSGTHHVVTITLTSLALSQYGSFTGYTGSKVFHASALAAYPGPTNSAQLLTLTTQIANDWYLWQLGRTNLSIVGYPGWTLSGLEDAVQLRHESGRIFTRILRGTFDDDVEELFYVGSAGSEQPPSGNFSLTVMEDDSDPIVLNVDTIQFEAGEFVVTEPSAGVAHIALGCRIVRHIDGPPPWTPPDGVCCNEQFSDNFGYMGIWKCHKDDWDMFCPCLPTDRPPSGSGSGDDPTGGCVEGECAICTEPPDTWDLPAAGFTGDCTIFNRAWELQNVSECVWRDAYVVNGVNVSVTLTLDGGGHTLEFVGFTAAGELVTADYTCSASTLPECCNALTFASSACGCDVANAGGDNVCSECTTTPSIWTVALSGFIGCFARFNGTWTLTQTPDLDSCRWVFKDDVFILWTINSDGSGTLDLADGISRATGSYVSGVFGPNCCSNVTANKVFLACGTRLPIGGPASVTLAPQCSGGGGACPATLTATPVCCGDLPDDEPVCECEQCPDGMPTRWNISRPTATGDFVDAAEIQFLDYVSGCTYRATYGVITCTLAYDAVKERWYLTYEHSNGTSLWEMVNADPFNCCGVNMFVLNSHQGIGHIDNEITIRPDGPCTPCDGGGGIDSSCCGGVPATLTVTFYDGTGSCTCMNDIPSFDIVYDAEFFNWYGGYEGCSGADQEIAFGCVVMNWGLWNTAASDSCFSNGTLIDSNCDPDDFWVEFTATAPLGGACCTGTFKIRIEGP